MPQVNWTLVHGFVNIILKSIFFELMRLGSTNPQGLVMPYYNKIVQWMDSYGFHLCRQCLHNKEMNTFHQINKRFGQLSIHTIMLNKHMLEYSLSSLITHNRFIVVAPFPLHHTHSNIQGDSPFRQYIRSLLLHYSGNIDDMYEQCAHTIASQMTGDDV